MRRLEGRRERLAGLGMARIAERHGITVMPGKPGQGTFTLPSHRFSETVPHTAITAAVRWGVAVAELKLTRQDTGRER